MNSEKLVATQIKRSAEISDCCRYRWWLRRDWILRDEEGVHVPGKGIVCFIMLNPSTADGTQDDPTIRRCISFATRWGFNGISVRNLFPYRTTYPSELKKVDCSVTGANRGDMELIAASTAHLVVAAWGAGVPFRRDQQVMQMIRTAFPSLPIYCLGRTKQGYPKHPLYVRSDTELQLFTQPGW